MRALFVVAVLGVAACSTPEPATTTQNIQTESTLATSGSATAYVDEALAIMRTNSVFTDSTDWEDIETSMRRESQGAQVPEDTYSAIELGLRLIDDPFAVFVNPTDIFLFESEPADFEEPVVETRLDRYGYVAAGQFIGDPGAEADEFAGNLARRIEAISGEVCGWVLDLRVTRFGVVEPPLGGLAPLLDPGEIGTLSRPNGTTQVLENQAGGITLDGTPLVSNAVEDPSGVGLPVAILIGSITGQPGEMIAAAFRGQSDVRMFGQPTRGTTTWVDPYFLSDGAVVALSAATFADRLGVHVETASRIVPDVVTANANDSEQAAIDWLATQPSCQ